MSIEGTDRMASPADTADTAKGPVPLLQMLGDAATPICVDGFCEVPGADAATVQPTNSRGADK